MTPTDFLYLTPILIVAAATLVMMLTVAVSRNYFVVRTISLVTLSAAFLSALFLVPPDQHVIPPLFIFDSFSLFFLRLLLAAALFIAFLSDEFFKDQSGEKEEYFIILFIATLGACLLLAANHFISLFLGIETLSISLYVLIAYTRRIDLSVEAGVKYLVLASASSAFLLFGMALMYAGTGSMEFRGITAALDETIESSPLLQTGLGMIMVGLGFKLAVVPFHMWTPDVYQGAPAPVTTFIATISKGAVIAVLLRFFIGFHPDQHPAVTTIITIIAVSSMFTGNILALKQTNIKRILAYSSIANLGYLLITLLTTGTDGARVAFFYLTAYFITTIGAFSIVSLLTVCGDEADQLRLYKGLFWKRPWIALVFTLTMLSLAGIPLTAGFMSKFYLVFGGMKSSLWLLVISLIVNSVISLYYYLRVITALFSASDDKEVVSVSVTGNILLTLIAIGILWLGIMPGWLFDQVLLITGTK